VFHTQITAATNPQWMRDRRVRRILASFAKTPPQMEMIPHHERWDRDDTRYTGFRCECLRVLRRSILDPAFKEAQIMGDHDLAHEIAFQPSVAEAIDQSLRIQPMFRTTTPIRQLDPSAWAFAKCEQAA
jgi:hypothetical protein